MPSNKSLFALFAGAVLAATANATVLTSKISMDNGFSVYLATADNVQGTSFGSGNDWTQTFVHTSPTLLAGTDYYLHVYGYDQGGIGGFLGEFSLSAPTHLFANSQTTLLTNTTNWTGNAVGFNGTYGAVGIANGNNGVGPWNLRPNISPSATWIWVGDPDTNNISYFTTKISAQSSGVPDSGSSLVLLLGSVGLVLALRRKRAG